MVELLIKINDVGVMSSTIFDNVCFFPDAIAFSYYYPTNTTTRSRLICAAIITCKSPFLTIKNDRNRSTIAVPMVCDTGCSGIRTTFFCLHRLCVCTVSVSLLAFHYDIVVQIITTTKNIPMDFFSHSILLRLHGHSNRFFFF